MKQETTHPKKAASNLKNHHHRNHKSTREQANTFTHAQKNNHYISIMHLMYYLDSDGKRIYTFKKETPGGKVTESAHPARFSPDDKFSRHRIACKKRFGIYLPDSPLPKPM
mmetsp:Transcript_24853/g.36868  ORF Transcript_24853/g.36868 Transcript_24853/m.36868 type:complete len:111 (+) Transcript_24853:2-334(+)